MVFSYPHPPRISFLLPVYNSVRYLSRDDKISYALADPSLKMLHSLIKTIKEPNTADNLNAKIAALSAMGNIALLAENHPAMLAPDLDLLRVMIRVLCVSLYFCYLFAS